MKKRWVIVILHRSLEIECLYCERHLQFTLYRGILGLLKWGLYFYIPRSQIRILAGPHGQRQHFINSIHGWTLMVLQMHLYAIWPN